MFSEMKDRLSRFKITTNPQEVLGVKTWRTEMSALMCLAGYHEYTHDVKLQKKLMVEILMADKENINNVDIYHDSALTYAIMHSHPEIVHLLLENGANPSQKMMYGSALYVAVLYRRKEVVERLATDDCLDARHEMLGTLLPTPLELALHMNFIEGVRILDAAYV